MQKKTSASRASFPPNPALDIHPAGMRRVWRSELLPTFLLCPPLLSRLGHTTTVCVGAWRDTRRDLGRRGAGEALAKRRLAGGADGMEMAWARANAVTGALCSPPSPSRRVKRDGIGWDGLSSRARNATWQLPARHGSDGMAKRRSVSDPTLLRALWRGGGREPPPAHPLRGALGRATIRPEAGAGRADYHGSGCLGQPHSVLRCQRSRAHGTAMTLTSRMNGGEEQRVASVRRGTHSAGASRAQQSLVSGPCASSQWPSPPVAPRLRASRPPGSKVHTYTPTCMYLHTVASGHHQRHIALFISFGLDRAAWGLGRASTATSG